MLLPIGGMRMVRNLASFSNGRMLLLAGDKGYNTKQEMSSLRDPHVAVHGSFSFMVRPARTRTAAHQARSPDHACTPGQL